MYLWAGFRIYSILNVSFKCWGSRKTALIHKRFKNKELLQRLYFLMSYQKNRDMIKKQIYIQMSSKDKMGQISNIETLQIPDDVFSSKRSTFEQVSEACRNVRNKIQVAQSYFDLKMIIILSVCLYFVYRYISNKFTYDKPRIRQHNSVGGQTSKLEVLSEDGENEMKRNIHDLLWTLKQ